MQLANTGTILFPIDGPLLRDPDVEVFQLVRTFLAQRSHEVAVSSSSSDLGSNCQSGDTCKLLLDGAASTAWFWDADVSVRRRSFAHWPLLGCLRETVAARLSS